MFHRYMERTHHAGLGVSLSLGPFLMPPSVAASTFLDLEASVFERLLWQPLEPSGTSRSEHFIRILSWHSFQGSALNCCYLN